MESLTIACILLILSALVFHRFGFKVSHQKVRLRGPTDGNLFFGVARRIRISPQPHVLYENWAKQYGSVYRLPLLVGSEAVVVSDLKAVAHVLSKDTYTYVRSPGSRAIIDQVIGRGLLWVEGDVHRRQRKTMNPAFSPGVIKRMAPSFYDATYKLKSVWDRMLDSDASGTKVQIEMHEWTMKLVLDTVGNTVFGYQFNTLDGKKSKVEEALRVFNTTTLTKLGMLAHTFAIFLPWARKLPTKRNQLYKDLSESTRIMLEGVMSGENSDLEGDAQTHDKSIVELFVKEAEDDGCDPQSPEGKEEILAKMKNLLIAGSDSPGIMLVWVLIELARHPEMQTRVREEITACPGAELEWSTLQFSCPYLDAVISEVLRLRLTVGETLRVANEDDILHLKEPILDASGQLVERITIMKGTSIIIPNHYLNSSPSLWGPDGLEFNPERWMSTYLTRSGDEPNDVISERRRLWTFGEGPRICVGKAFVMVQMKIVLAVLLRHFIFELPQGPETPMDIHYSLVRRPKVKGMEGAMIPFFVSRVDGITPV